MYEAARQFLGRDLAGYLPTFLMILLRLSIMVSVLPFFASKMFPNQFKIGVAMAMAFMLTPVLHFQADTSSIGKLIIGEVFLGMLIGLVSRVVFMAVNVAGQAISYSMGLSMATVFDPEFGQSAEISRLLGVFAMLIFFSVNAHHDVILMFARSFELIPPGTLKFNSLLPLAILCGTKIFSISLKLAAPIMVGMVIATMLFGYVYKAAPQINIFFVSYPVYIFVGLIILIFSVPVFTQTLVIEFEGIKRDMYNILIAAGGR